MNGRLQFGLVAVLAFGLFAILLQPQAASAQDPSSRFRVMVPEIQPQGDADDKFGERLADRLRDLINEMATHQPIEERELRRALNQYDIDMEDLDCTRARQLAGLINAQVIFCGTYVREGETFVLDVKFVDSAGEEFPVDPVTVPRRDGQREAAQAIYEALQVQSDQARASQFCGDYASSQQWDDAERQCTLAIDLNPGAVGSRYTLGVVYRETDRLEEALTQFEDVLEMDPLHESAMQFAGWICATLGRDEEARNYYQNYLELNPGNAGVRMSVAYELAQAGDPLGAMQFIEVGLELEPENVDLLKQHGGFAFSAGQEANQGQAEMTAEAAELFRKALVSFDRVYAIEGQEMDVSYLRNMIAAHINLEEFEEAVTLGGRVLETHAEESVIWSIYADALQRNGQVDEAITALDRVMALDPEYPNVAVRQGNWLMQEGRVEDAIAALQRAVERGEQTSDAVALQVVFANGVNEGVQKQNWPHAIRVLRLAKEFEVSDITRQQLDFWLGYSIFQSARIQQEPQTLETARATLPRFQEALRLMQNCSDYTQRNNFESNRQDVISATNTFIEIQDAIIRRGR